MRKIFRNDWAELLNDELNEPYYQQLRKFLIDEYSTRKIFPNMYDIFNALPVSRAGTGARLELFGFARRAAAAVAYEHLQGTARRFGLLRPRQRLLETVGRSRRLAVERGLDGQSARGEFTSRTRLGTVHR